MALTIRHYRLLFVPVFMATTLAVLHLAFGFDGSALPNYDEGMYILQARAVQEGQVPCKDFFCHQPPAFVQLLATSGATGSLHSARLPGTLLTVLLLALAIALRSRRRTHLALGLAAFVPLLLHPQARYYLLAMPNATAIAAALAGLVVLLHNRHPLAQLCGILLLGAAGALKFLAIPLILVAVLLYLHRNTRRPAPAALLGILGLCITFGGAHLATQGAIWQGIADQLARMLHPTTGVQFWHEMQSGWPTTIPDATTWTQLQWQRAWQASAAGLLAATLALAPATLLRARLRRAPFVLALYGSLAIAGLLLFQVVAPVWNHYFVVFPLLASMLWFEGLKQVQVQYGNRATAMAAATAILFGIALFRPPEVPENWRKYVVRLEQESAQTAPDTPLLSFSPLLNVLADRPPACGLRDPMNTYGSASLAARYRPALAIQESALISCLQTYPEVLVWAGYEYRMLVSEEMDYRLRQLPNLRWIDQR